MLPTIEALAAALSAGRTTSVALTETALTRGDVAGEGATVFTRIDADRALALARASDGLRAAGIVRSPLEGLPVSIKDLFDVAGQTTYAGSVLLRDAAPPGQRHRGRPLAGRRCRDRRGANMDRVPYSGLGLNPASRHAAQSLAARRGPSSGRFVFGRGGFGERRHGRGRHRHERADRCAFPRRCAG